MLRVLGWLVWDTFRQSIASRLFWILVAVTVLSVLLCLSVSTPKLGKAMVDLEEDPLGEIYLPDGKTPLADVIGDPERKKLGTMSVGWGLFQVEYFRDARDQVQFLQVILAVGVAGAMGTLLVLVWTGAFLPEFLHPSAASVLLAKPIPRSLLLVGKYLGVLVFVAVMAAVFVFGTWAALGIKTGYWMPGYLASLPLLLLNFATVYGFSALLAVMSRNTIACVFGSVVFWVLCFAMNYGRHASVSLPEIMTQRAATAPAPASEKAPTPAQPAPEQPKETNEPPVETSGLAESKQSTTPPQVPEPVKEVQVAQQSPALRYLVEAGYWILPKPADLGILLDRAVSGNKHLATPQEFEVVERNGQFFPVLSVLASILASAVLLGMAAWEFERMDY